MNSRQLVKPKISKVSDCDIVEPEPAEIAEYIYSMCVEFATMAEKAKMPMLWYFLKLAGAEANTICRGDDINPH